MNFTKLTKVDLVLIIIDSATSLSPQAGISSLSMTITDELDEAEDVDETVFSLID